MRDVPQGLMRIVWQFITASLITLKRFFSNIFFEIQFFLKKRH
ncbi:Uncharacterized protein dnm_040600 [Desulfonema magnum]|uniref:Uncharacterized protein n=1 Tax=Desulfonema magnum TaxID=45655 RepID=A0A975GNQ3_9BACT|nr:Uncharacterized protein dnm_040600 [Desulfonema magnum]